MVHLNLGSSLLLILLPRCFVEGQKYSCEVQLDGKCIIKVTCQIPEAYRQEGRPFTVSYISNGQTEKAVVLHHVGRYICDAAGDHICDQNTTSITINPQTSCVENREYILAADGETGIHCSTIKSQQKPLDSGEEENVVCPEDTAVGDETNSHVNKREAPVRCRKRSSPEQEERFQSEKSESPVAIIVGCVVAAVVILVGVLTALCFLKKTGRLGGCSYGPVSTDPV